MTDTHDHGPDWLGVSLAAAKYAGDRGAVRAAYWMTPPAVGAGLLCGWAARVLEWGIDPLFVGAGVAFLLVFLAPYVHFWARIATRRVRGVPPAGGPPDGPHPAADRADPTPRR